MKPALKPAAEENASLTVSNWIKARPARVFRALTTPEEMNRWFAPNLDTMRPDMTAEVKVGGRYNLLMHRAGKPEPQNAFGRYLEIVPDKKLVFSWGWPASTSCGDGQSKKAFGDESIVTIELREKDGGTEVILTHEKLPAKQAEDHRGGWTGCLASLKAYAEAN